MTNFCIFNTPHEKIKFISEIVDKRLKLKVQSIENVRPRVRKEISAPIACKMAMDEINLQDRLSLIADGLRYFHFTQREIGPRKVPVVYGVYGYEVSSIFTQAELEVHTVEAMLESLGSFDNPEKFDQFIEDKDSFTAISTYGAKLVTIGNKNLVIFTSASAE